MNSRIYIWRNRLILLLASLLILTALLFGLLRLFLPHVTDYGDKIRSQLSKQLGIPVDIKTVNAEIWWLSPRLKLSEVDIYDAAGTRQILHVNEILVGFDWLASIRQRQLQLGFISFNGAHLQVRHLANGSWQIQGMTLPAAGDGPLNIPPEILSLLEETSVYVHDIQLDWHDEQRNNQKLLISNLNISLLNDAPNHELAIDLQLPPAYGGHVRLLIELNGPIEQPDLWQGRLYAAVERLQLKPWFNDYWQLFSFTADGQLDASVWIDWQALQIKQVHSYLKGEQLALHYLNKDVNSWTLNQLIGNFRWQHTRQGWQADVSGLEIHRKNTRWRQPSTLSLLMDAQQQQLKLRASYVQMDDLAYMAGLGNSFLQSEQDWNTPLQAWQPRGELFDVDAQVSIDTPTLDFFGARFVDASFSSQQKGVPSISGLDGRLSYHQQQARILLDSQQVTVDFKDLFRQPLQLQSIKSDIFVSHSPQGTELFAADINMVSPHLATHSRLHVVAKPNAPVFMDLLSNYDHGQGAYAGLYLPVGIMGKGVVEWLDQALVAATIPQGGFLFYGQLRDFPFADNQGVMLAQFNVTQGQLNYQAGWPAIKNLDARVRFRNSEMLIDQGAGNIFGAKLENTTVSIDKLDAALLAINGDVSGPLNDLVQFVGASPLKEPLEYVSHMQTTGNATLGLELEIPIAVASDPLRVNGRLTLTGNELFLPDTNYRFNGVNGVLRFTEASLEADRIRASLDGYPLSLRIDPVQIDGIDHSRLLLQGYVPVASAMAPIPAWKNRVTGGSDMQMTLDIPMHDRPDDILVAISAQGNMQGVSSQLPLFLAKAANDSGAMRFDLDLLKNGDLNIRAAHSGRYEAQAQRRQQRWSVDVDSAMLRGKASFMEDFTQDEQLQLDLEYLDLAAVQASQSIDEPTAKKSGNDESVLPTQIPPLKINIARLDWNKVQLQNIDVQTRRTENGMEIDSLKLNGPDFSVDGRGSWLSAWRVPHVSRFDFKVKAQNLGASLAQMGLSQSLEKTQGEANIRWRWQDSPQNFEWSIVSGDADINLKDGRLQHVEAGTAGRMLGIFNFRTLLSLDFGDQVRGGFAFDEVTAHYTFANGNAYSDDFKIQSKVAEISMQGRIGLVKEDFDQTITVVPGVSNTLTLIGTVAGGPVTGVLVHVFQKILGVDKLAGYKYTVEGSWDKPKVLLVEAPKTDNDESVEP